MRGARLGDEKVQAKTRKRQRSKEGQLLLDTREILSTASGRRFLYRLIEDVTNTFGGSYDDNAMRMARNEGRRDVGIDLVELCQDADPDGYWQMLQEALAYQQDNKRADEASNEEIDDE